MVASPYDYWLLDLDGTLVDVEADYAHHVFDRVGDRLGREFTDREIEVLWHGYGGLRDEQLQAWGIAPDDFWSALHEVEEPTERAAATYLHEDAAIVADLDVPVGLVTHCQPFLTESVFDRLDIGGWFDAVVHCSPELGWKPDPAPVHRAMSELEVAGDHRGALVGDGPHDIGAAWNAGLDGIHLERHDPHRRGLCVLGDYRISTLTELPV